MFRKKIKNTKIKIINKDKAIATDEKGNEIELTLFTEEEIEKIDKIKKEIKRKD